jgi:hypothetical protein
MLLRGLGAFVFALALSSAAFAHGGGGGGGGHGGHVIVTGIYVSGGGLPPPPDPEIGDTSHIASVAILSSLGQNLQLRSTGGDWVASKKMVDVSMWGLDDFITDTLSRHLSARFAVKTVSYDRKGLAAVPTGDGRSSAEVLHKYLSTIQTPGVDALVLIRPDDAGSYPYRPGLSLIMSESPYPPSEWLGFEIEILDAHTYQRISWGFARMQYRAGTLPTFAAYRAAGNRALDDTLTPTQAQFQSMRKDFQYELAIVIAHTLRAMKLGLPIPEPGDEPLVPIPPQAKPIQQVHNVAVVSAIGDTFTFGYRTVLFQHHATQVPVTDGKLDADVEAMIAAKLDKRFTVKAVPIDRASLGKMSATITGAAPSPIAGLSPRDDIDAYFVILKRAGVDGNLGDSTTGIGIFKNKPLGDENTYVFAHYEFVIVDAHTLKVLGQRSGIASPHWPSPIPGRPIDNGVWPNGDVDALASGQDIVVKQVLHDVIADSIGETLLSTGLTGMKRDLQYNAEPVPAAEMETPDAGAGMQLQ